MALIRPAVEYAEEFIGCSHRAADLRIGGAGVIPGVGLAHGLSLVERNFGLGVTTAPA